MRQITNKYHTPTLTYWSTPESTSVYAIPSPQIQAQKSVFSRRDFYVFFIAEPIPIDQNNIITIASAPFDQWVYATSNWCRTLSASLCRATIVLIFQVRGTNPHTWHPQSLASLQRIFSRNLGGTIFGPFSTERNFMTINMILKSSFIRKLPSPSSPPLSTNENQTERLHLSYLQVRLFRRIKTILNDFTCRSITHIIAKLATVKDHSCNAQNFFNPQPQEKSCYFCSHTTSPHIL